jgi:hypothetical protein
MGAPGSPNDLERLLQILGPRLDELRTYVDEFGGRWRGDAARFSGDTKRRVLELGRELGFVTRAEWEELDLRLAQVEHRLRLLEDADDRP